MESAASGRQGTNAERHTATSDVPDSLRTRQVHETVRLLHGHKPLHFPSRASAAAAASASRHPAACRPASSPLSLHTSDSDLVKQAVAESAPLLAAAQLASLPRRGAQRTAQSSATASLRARSAAGVSHGSRTPSRQREAHTPLPPRTPLAARRTAAALHTGAPERGAWTATAGTARSRSAHTVLSLRDDLEAATPPFHDAANVLGSGFTWATAPYSCRYGAV
jgi:hypothetical protein